MKILGGMGAIMDLKKYFDDIAPRGKQAEIARILDVDPVLVSQWKRKVRPVPAVHCPAFVVATENVVTYQDLRPNDWYLIWPELPGAAELHSIQEQPAHPQRRASDKAPQITPQISA